MGMPGGSFSFGGGGGRGHGMSADEAEFLFSQFFGGSDPFGGLGGRRGGGPGIRINMGGRLGMQDPFGSFGVGSGMGGQPFGRSSYTQPKRYNAIPAGTIVSLKGLVSRPERNGDRGEVVQYDPSTGRYVVQIEDSEETIKVKPSNLLQHVHVKLHGLESRADLNGEKATILAWDDSKERYNIYVMSISKVISLKPSNITRKWYCWKDNWTTVKART